MTKDEVECLLAEHALSSPGEWIHDTADPSAVGIRHEIPPEQQRPYQDRLKRLVASRGDKWELIGSYSQTQDGIMFANSLHVYARRPVASLTIATPAIRLDRLRALMVRKELR